MKRFVSLIIATVLLLAVACACARPARALGAAELLDLGEKYLLEMNYAQAAVYFERLIEVEPRNPRGYTGLSEAYLGLDDAGGAVSALRDGFAKLRDDGEFLGELAERYEGIIEGAPDTQDAYIGLADVLLALGDDDGAADALRRGLEQLPDSRRIAAMLAELDAASKAESPGDSAQAESGGAVAEAQGEPSLTSAPASSPTPLPSPSPAPLPTPSPAPSPVPSPVDVFPAMSKAEHEALHRFFSDFSEFGFESFDINSYDENALISYALRWNWSWRNNADKFTDTGREVMGSDGWVNGKYWSAPANLIEQTVTRFFGVTVKNRDAFTPTVIEDGYYSKDYYGNGNYYKFEPNASGEAERWAQVTAFVDNGNGTYTARYDEYSGFLDNKYDDKTDWPDWGDDYREYRYERSCAAVVRPYDNNGEATYQLISLATAEPVPAVAAPTPTPEPAATPAVDHITIKGKSYSTSLTELYINSMDLANADIEPLRLMTNLKKLYLQVNQISDLSPLAGLTKLNTLWLHTNQISDISPLAGLTNLAELGLRTNQISDISPLAELEQLNSLNLNTNQISDISPLAGLEQLEDLSLSTNQISDISPLARLVQLEFLRLDDNQISDVSPLAGMIQLEYLYLADNPISDWLPVAHVDHVSGRP